MNNENILRPYQKEAIQFLESNNGNGMLAMDMGLGKTLCSLAYTDNHHYKALVVVPNSLKFTWENEIAKWFPNKTCQIIEPKTKSINFTNDYIIISNTLIHKLFNIVKKGKRQYFNLKSQFEKPFGMIDCVILDESHSYKNASARRSKAVKHIPIKRKVLLTGTPCWNLPIDLWHQLHLIDPDKFNNFFDFRNRFTSGYTHPYMGFYIITGTKNEEELAQLIKPYLFRRLKEDVEDLPPKIYNKIPVNLIPSYQKKYIKAIEDFREFLQQFTDLTPQEIYRRISNETLTRIMELKKICTDSKLESGSVSEIIENILDTGEKIVVFSYFKDTAKKLHSQFKNSVLICGDVPTDIRQERIDKFSTDPKTKIFFATISTASVGLTLTAASNVVFVELPWTSSEKDQAESRCHRISTTANVNIFDIVTRNSVEDNIYAMLSKKEDVISKILDGKRISKKINIKERIIQQQIQSLL